MPTLKKVAKVVGAVVAALIVGVGGYAGSQIAAFDASMARVYELPPVDLKVTSDAAAIARGKHLTESLGACSLRDCHGSDFGSGKPIEAGPLGVFAAPNLTLIVPAYSDGELARLLRYGIRKDGRSLRFMPVQEFSWWRDEDVAAAIAYLRTLPRIERQAGTMQIRTLAKILDRRDLVKIDIARRLVEQPPTLAPPPSPTKEYGAFLAHLCKSCHGETLSGGKIPGTPPSIPIPSNLTPDASGLGPSYTYEQFGRLMVLGIKQNGVKLDPFMPIEAIARMDEVEKRALFAYLRSIPARHFGNR